jgi:hypothetical protein
VWILDWFSLKTLYSISHILIFVGILIYLISKFVHKIPYVKDYQLPIELVGLFSAIFSAYIFMNQVFEREWTTRENNVEIQFVEIIKEVPVINTKVVKELVEKTKYITVEVEKIKTEIQIQKEYINKDCTINKESIDLYNKALADPIEQIKDGL